MKNNVVNEQNYKDLKVIFDRLMDDIDELLTENEFMFSKDIADKLCQKDILNAQIIRQSAVSFYGGKSEYLSIIVSNHSFPSLELLASNVLKAIKLLKNLESFINNMRRILIENGLIENEESDDGYDGYCEWIRGSLT